MECNSDFSSKYSNNLHLRNAHGVSGVAIADNDSINTAFGTQVAPTAKAHSGTANDLDVTAYC